MSKTTKPTFGYWKVEADKQTRTIVIKQDEDYLRRFAKYKNNTPVIIAQYTVSEDADWNQAIANAQLMATAKELYDKLENLKDESYGVLNDLARNHVDATTLIGVYKQAKAALVQALDVEQHS